jgi:hypothetical protein
MVDVNARLHPEKKFDDIPVAPLLPWILVASAVVLGAPPHDPCREPVHAYLLDDIKRFGSLLQWGDGG